MLRRQCRLNAGDLVAPVKVCKRAAHERIGVVAHRRASLVALESEVRARGERVDHHTSMGYYISLDVPVRLQCRIRGAAPSRRRPLAGPIGSHVGERPGYKGSVSDNENILARHWRGENEPIY